MNKIRITAGHVSVEAELNDKPTARMIWDALPIEGAANTWGDEIYFGIPVKTDEEPDAQEIVEVGTLGYWPVGHAFCIFFGRTPVSRDERPRAYSPVNLLGKVLGDATEFKGVTGGTKVLLERVD